MSLDQPQRQRRRGQNKCDPVVCPVCGRRVVRKSRQHRYCGRRCMRRDAYHRKVAEGRLCPFPPRTTARVPDPPENSRKNNGLRSTKTEPKVEFALPLNLVGGGDFKWPGTPKLAPVTAKNITTMEVPPRQNFGSSQLLPKKGNSPDGTRR